MRARDEEQRHQREYKNLECAGRAKRRRRFGSSSIQNAVKSKAVSLPTSRDCHRTPNLVSKNQNPVTFCQRSAAGSDGIFYGRKFPVRPEHLFAGVQNCDSVPAGLLASASLKTSDALHSGATARDSHPLPYSPRFYAGHLNALSKIRKGSTRRKITPPPLSVNQ